jgi:hypothetical protein
MKNSEFCKSTRRRSSFVGVLPVAVPSLFFLSFSFNSLADGYKVDYAIDAEGVAESEGPVECTYGRSCRLYFKLSHITLYLDVSGSQNTRRVSIFGGNGCCYFLGGDHTKDINEQYYNNKKNYIEDYNYQKRYIKLDIFAGRERSPYGLEIVGGTKIGTVFLGLP